jgi:hypothetical protein
MLTLAKKVKESIRRDGLSKTALKIIKYLITSPRNQKFGRNALVNKSVEERFTWIYTSNYWRNEESASGAGSTLDYTKILREELPFLFSQYSIKKILDAPCGDFNWMRHLLQTVDVEYVGADIVSTLIDELNKKYKNGKVSFICVDLVKDALPKSDLMICRDCLFHLSYDDAKSVLKNFISSGTPYLLTTTHTKTDGFRNEDILTGDFRLIDLFSAPYDFPLNPLASIEDWIAPHPERRMCLWSRDQVSVAFGGIGQGSTGPTTPHGP